MKRTIEVELEIKCKNAKTAIKRFFKKYPKLSYWKEQFEYMAENNIDFENDGILADGSKNKEWRWALHLDVNEDTVYMCVIERE